MRSNLYRHATTAALIASFVLTVPQNAPAQDQYRPGRVKTRPDASQRASVMQVIGIDTEISIVYHRPAVRGRNVWSDNSIFEQIGRLVPYNGDPRPWRAGANETTTISFENEVKIEGQPLPAGTYGLFMIPTDKDWTIIFSETFKSWGSFTYNQADDALRVIVTPVKAGHEERLVYGFQDHETYAATAFLHWEKKKIRFRIELADRKAERATQDPLPR